MKRATLVAVLAAGAAALVGAQTEKLDYAMLGRIRDEGLKPLAGDGPHLAG